ncbi:hypothetical protein Q0812_13570 [Brevundimonas sp. 2R-24]|uniref:DUF1579 domain-containing protein n=1 Tax=Peiella sedimenti TaxID=3061083 RepID=A0ABT8SPJ3_9CAUL|nr:hypothetical protein [Caulobacteraceae bacterium XZ-24]
MRLFTRIALAAGLAFTGGSALAQTQSPPPAPAAAPCSAPEYRTLDFWVGDWIAEWDASPGTPAGTGSNRVTRDEYGDCVITEHFEGAGLKGHSISTYRPAGGVWRQTWMDDQGGYFDLRGGPVEGQDHVFYFETIRPRDNMPRQRMIWQDVTADSFTWRWQNKPATAAESDPWQDQWVVRYRRR